MAHLVLAHAGSLKEPPIHVQPEKHVIAGMRHEGSLHMTPGGPIATLISTQNTGGMHTEVLVDGQRRLQSAYHLFGPDGPGIFVDHMGNVHSEEPISIDNARQLLDMHFHNEAVQAIQEKKLFDAVHASMPGVPVATTGLAEEPAPPVQQQQPKPARALQQETTGFMASGQADLSQRPDALLADALKTINLHGGRALPGTVPVMGAIPAGKPAGAGPIVTSVQPCGSMF